MPFIEAFSKNEVTPQSWTGSLHIRLSLIYIIVKFMLKRGKMVSLLNLLLIFASRKAAVVMLSPRDNPRLGLDAEPL